MFLKKRDIAPLGPIQNAHDFLSPLPRSGKENTTTKLKWLVTNDYIMAIVLHFNLGNILSQHSSVVGDMSLLILQSPRGIIFSVTKWDHGQFKTLSQRQRRKFNNIKTPTVLEIVVCLV